MAENENRNLPGKIRYPLIIGLALNGLLLLTTFSISAQPSSPIGCAISAGLGCQTGSCPTTGVCPTLTINPGQVRGIVTIVFPQPFATIPKDATAWFIAEPGGSAATWSDYAILSNGPAMTWTNMPAAQTEIFGDTTHRVEASLDSLNSARLSLTCTVASNTAGAYLKAQFSTNRGATWTDLNTNSFAHAIIDNTKCPGQVTTGSFAVATDISADLMFRVVGVGGGGVGDVPAFTEVQIELQYLISSYFIVIPQDSGHLMTTSMLVEVVDVTTSTGTVFFTIQWRAET